ncbi:MAG: hypothetical protein ACI9J5_003190, partial [Paraglaciecola sp.]
SISATLICKYLFKWSIYGHPAHTSSTLLVFTSNYQYRLARTAIVMEPCIYLMTKAAITQ